MNEAKTNSGADTPGTRDRSRGVRRQLLTLVKVHGQSSYRAALMPVIKEAVARIEGDRENGR